MNARAGIIYVKVDGLQYDAKGEFTWNLGAEKREGIPGADGKNHGFKTSTQIPFIEGKITDSGTLSMKKLTSLTDATATVELANGKVFVLKNAYYAAEGTVSSEEGEVEFRLEGMDADEIL